MEQTRLWPSKRQWCEISIIHGGVRVVGSWDTFVFTLLKLSPYKFLLGSPINLKEIQWFTCYIVPLSKFISYNLNKCLPLIRLLRKKYQPQWMDDSENAFQQLKHYLSSPPPMSYQEIGEELNLYLVSFTILQCESLFKGPMHNHNLASQC